MKNHYPINLKPEEWLPSEFIILYLRSLIQKHPTKKYLLIDYVAQGVEHHENEKNDLCLNCMLEKLALSEKTDGLLVPYINKGNKFSPHYRFIHIELKRKHILFWDPFGEETLFSDFHDVQEKIIHMPCFNGFTAQTLLKKAQNDGHSCGDWIMQCYTWSIYYNFDEKSSEKIDQDHAEHIQLILTTLEKNKKNIRDDTNKRLRNLKIDSEPVLPTLKLMKLSPKDEEKKRAANQARSYFYQSLSSKEKITCLKKMIKKEQNYHYLFDMDDLNNSNRVNQFLQKEEHRQCFIEILKIVQNFSLFRLSIFYKIIDETNHDSYLQEIIKNTISNIKNDSDFENFLKYFLEIPINAIPSIKKYYNTIQKKVEKNYCIDQIDNASIFQEGLFEKFYKDSSPYQLFAKFFSTLFDTQKNYCLKKTMATLLFLECQVNLSQKSEKLKSFKLSECILNAILEADDAPVPLQQDIFVSFLMLHGPDDQTQLLKSIAPTTPNKKAIGNGMLELSFRTQSTLLTFYNTHQINLSITQLELLINATLQALSKNPLFFLHKKSFSPTLENYLFNTQEKSSCSSELMNCFFLNEKNLFYFRCVIRALPIIAAPTTMKELHFSLEKGMGELFRSRQSISPQLTFNFIILVSKIKNAIKALDSLNAVIPQENVLGFFKNALNTNLTSRESYLLIESFFELLFILYTTDNFLSADKHMKEFFLETYLQEDYFSQHPLEDQNNLVEKIKEILKRPSNMKLNEFLQKQESKNTAHFLKKLTIDPSTTDTNKMRLFSKKTRPPSDTIGMEEIFLHRTRQHVLGI